MKQRVYSYSLRQTRLSDVEPCHLDDGPALAAAFRAALPHHDRESFLVAYLGCDFSVTGLDVIATGGTDSVEIDPVLVFRTAVALGCKSLALCHNHPSGLARPSAADLAMTTRLIEAGAWLGIGVVEHIIITTDNTDFFSFRANYNLTPRSKA